jgi:cytochrome c biogenesis protein CcdA
MEGLIEHLLGWMESSVWLAFLGAFIGGLLTATNPCVIAAAPLAIAYVGGYSSEEKKVVRNSFIISLFIVLGLATTFTITGVVAALTGQYLGAMGVKWRYVVAGVCLLVGLHLLGVFSFAIPGIHKLQIKSKGYAGAFLIGMLFGLISAPCAVPILAVILTMIAAKQQVMLGAFLLWTYAIGHCALIIVAGVSMGTVKKIVAEKKISKANVILQRFAGVLLLLLGAYIVLAR